MRALWTALLAAAAWTLAGCAPPAPAPSEPAIWRIADTDSEIWLYGSVHLLPPDLRWRGPRLETALAAVDELITETDTSDAAAAEIAALAQRYGTLPEGEQLSARLNEIERALLEKAASDLQLDLAVLQRQRPWLAAVQLSYAAALRAGHRVETGVEAVLLGEAARRGLRVSHLESAEQQIRVLADLSDEDQLRFLSTTLAQLEDGVAMMNETDAAWARGDVAALEARLSADWRETGPGVHEAVILQRNRVWADAIETRLEGSGRVLVVVGAAHLVGEGSVVDVLRARGIAVEGP